MMQMKQLSDAQHNSYHRIVRQIKRQELTLNELLDRLANFQFYAYTCKPKITKSVINKMRRQIDIAEDILNEVLYDTTNIRSFSPRYISIINEEQAILLCKQVDRQEKILHEISTHLNNFYATLQSHSIYQQKKNISDMQSGKLQNKILQELKRIQQIPSVTSMTHPKINLDFDIEQLTRFIPFLTNLFDIINPDKTEQEYSSSGNIPFNLDGETIKTITKFLTNLFNNTENEQEQLGIFGMLDLNLEDDDYTTIANLLSHYMNKEKNSEDSQENGILSRFNINLDANSLTTISSVLSQFFKNQTDDDNDENGGFLNGLLQHENFTTLTKVLPYFFNNMNDDDEQSFDILNIVTTLTNIYNKEENDSLFNMFNINLDEETIIATAPILIDIYNWLKQDTDATEKEPQTVD
ncbi:hypothetical protein [Bacillus massiliigorillae]|uniref:hypothetical protein n=1 Tax=Bacillus massiliigorillae TaxID=1243664 RepID=UPI00039D00AB|nr:hypothetical protein [Bacillus massiliigorillae]